MPLSEVKPFICGMLVLAGVASATVTLAKVPPAPRAPEIGRHEIVTVPFDPAPILRTATYTPSGKVLVSYAKAKGEDARHVNLATMDDDGRNLRPFFSMALPPRPKDNGLRYMVFPDNRRIFTGDFVIECKIALEACDKPELLPVDFPAEVAEGSHIANRWSEIVVSPDNRHVAWTTLLANYASAAVFVAELRREGDRYRMIAPRIVSTLSPFAKDPRHPDGVLPQPMRGGEVKQFVAGGTALSLVGAIKRDTPDSVVQHLADGALEAITDTPGYTETTIFSPDERLGLTMTTRFSPKTDPAILGLMPRPYPASLNMGLSMFAYTYAVTGVRRGRPGNIGPALIDVAASKRGNDYQGIDLSTDEAWVFRSPMSWHPGGRKAMWLEGRRDDGSVRMQVIHLPDYRAGAPVPARALPRMPYASIDLSVLKALAADTHNTDVKVYGRASGYITYRRSVDGTITKTYDNFSDDGRQVYSGNEQMQTNPRGRSTYTADVRLTGPKPGVMKLKVTFGPLGGDHPAALIFASDDAGKALTAGYAEYDGKRIEVNSLTP